MIQDLDVQLGRLPQTQGPGPLVCLTEIVRLCTAYIDHRVGRQSISRKLPVVHKLRRQAADELASLPLPAAPQNAAPAAPPPAADHYRPLPRPRAPSAGDAFPAPAPPMDEAGARAVLARALQRRQHADPFIPMRQLRGLQGAARLERDDPLHHFSGLHQGVLDNNAVLMQFRQPAHVTTTDLLGHIHDQHLDQLGEAWKPFFKGVSYLTAEGRAGCEVHVQGGRLFDHTRHKALHTSDDVFSSMEAGQSVKGQAIMAMSGARRLYTAGHVQAAFHHSSFLSGADVLFAGDWIVNQGQLLCLRPVSGHYTPTSTDLFTTVLALKAKGVDLSQCVIGWFELPGDFDPHHMTYYRALDFLRAFTVTPPAPPPAPGADKKAAALAVLKDTLKAGAPAYGAPLYQAPGQELARLPKPVAPGPRNIF